MDFEPKESGFPNSASLTDPVLFVSELLFHFLSRPHPDEHKEPINQVKFTSFYSIIKGYL